jgi:hypothetical protein
VSVIRARFGCGGGDRGDRGVGQGDWVEIDLAAEKRKRLYGGNIRFDAKTNQSYRCEESEPDPQRSQMKRCEAETSTPLPRSADRSSKTRTGAPLPRAPRGRQRSQDDPRVPRMRERAVHCCHPPPNALYRCTSDWNSFPRDWAKVSCSLNNDRCASSTSK